MRPLWCRISRRGRMAVRRWTLCGGAASGGRTVAGYEEADMSRERTPGRRICPGPDPYVDRVRAPWGAARGVRTGMPQEPMIGRRESSRPDAPCGPATKFVWNAIVAGNQGPGRRSRHSFAYDTGRKAIVLFGGIDWAAGGALLGDTWEFHTRRWSRVRTPDRPPARHRGAMVYSPQAGYSILFGGQGHEGWRFPLLNDTWTYANQEWSRWGKVTFTRPPVLWTCFRF